MAGRLKIIRPRLEDHTIVASVDNRMVAADLEAMRGQIESYLRQQLQNKQLTVKIVLEESVVIHHIYSRVEQFQILERRNPALRMLKESLDLDLS